MAVIQISRVQHRRGLVQDLPQLSAAEFGWAVDERRLFIGNGPQEEGAPTIGNTEVLTQYTDILGSISSYVYKGTDVGYTAQTSESTGDVQRTLQTKLDDFVNAKDFGVVGDGTTDDSGAINWMLYQVYCREATNAKSKKTIYFPPGIYAIKSTLKIPHEARLVGAGTGATSFRYEGATADYVARLADSRQQVGASMGLGGADYPRNIFLTGIRFKNNTDNDVFFVEQGQSIHFDDCSFVGNHPNDSTAPTNIGSRHRAVFAKEDTGTRSFMITFNRCNFSRTNVGFDCDTEISNIVFDECVFQLLFQGIICGENIISGNGPQGVKVTHSLFDKIYNIGVRTFTVKEFISAFNTYKDVGNQLLGVGNPSFPVIDFDGDNNYSLGDTFDRTTADDATQPRIENNKKKVYGILAADHVAYGTHRESPGQELTLADNNSPASSTGIDFDESVPENSIVDFTVKRGTAVRTGSLKVAGSNTAGYTLDQDYSENVDCGIAFFIDTGSGTITYTSTSTGSSATLNYRIRKFVT
jgi:hypothetical protein